MKKAYIVYYYPDSESGNQDCATFVAESTKDIKEQFIKYAEYAFDNIITEDDIEDYFEINFGLDDCNGNSYKMDYKLTKEI